MNAPIGMNHLLEFPRSPKLTEPEPEPEPVCLNIPKDRWVNYLAENCGFYTMTVLAVHLGCLHNEVKALMRKHHLSAKKSREVYQLEIRNKFAEFCEENGYTLNDVSRALRLRQKPGDRDKGKPNAD